MRAKRWGVVALGALMFGLIGCAGERAAEPEPTPEPLTVSEAGGLYLDAVCPVNAAWDAVDIEVDRLRIAHGRGDTDTTAFGDAMRDLGAASERAAKQLAPADRVWPAAAVDEVDAVRDSLIADAEQAAKVAELPIDEAVTYAWADAAEMGAAAAAAREVLGLPGDAVAACAQWTEQRAAAGPGETSGGETGAHGEN